MLGLDAFRRKPRNFEYKPLHYNPQEEARNERKKEILGDDAEQHKDEQGEYIPGAILRSSMRSRRGYDHASRAKRDRNIRRAVIALIILFTMLLYILGF